MPGQATEPSRNLCQTSIGYKTSTSSTEIIPDPRSLTSVRIRSIPQRDLHRTSSMVSTGEAAIHQPPQEARNVSGCQSHPRYDGSRQKYTTLNIIAEGSTACNASGIAPSTHHVAQAKERTGKRVMSLVAAADEKHSLHSTTKTGRDSSDNVDFQLAKERLDGE
ncbi:hypothetical protein B0O80DRAFT_495690 [Mortierella sp. GBAus27b]|nr:hypothetical protein B0O80DRAFT_495690 [Mortierella sp. GBAus27b]